MKDIPKRSATFSSLIVTLPFLLVFLILNLLIRVSSKEAIDSKVYYHTKTYWNDIPEVAQEVRRRITGDPDVDFDLHTLRLRGKPFEYALSIGSGNGWVERQLFKTGLIKSGLGTELLDSFVISANQEAAKLKYNITYIKHDINRDPLPKGPFDLVVIFAAAHHVGKIDYLMRQIAKILSQDGWFLLYEYCGHHRNQVDTFTWKKIHSENHKLPAHLRQNLHIMYANIETMLVEDASEAQHSELIMETIRRYFFILYFRAVGGAIAYPLLTHNQQFHAVNYDNTRKEVKQLLDADAKWLSGDPGRSLFNFFLATPLHGGTPDDRYSSLLEKHENEREEGGFKSKYYTPVRIHEKIPHYILDF